MGRMASEKTLRNDTSKLLIHAIKDYRHSHIVNPRILRNQLADHPETPGRPSVVCRDHTLGITIRRTETASVTQELRFSFACECVCVGEIPS